jgi:hypothetical protein
VVTESEVGFMAAFFYSPISFRKTRLDKVHPNCLLV